MSYVVLARKWRPMSFRDLVGQEHVARTLANAIAEQRVAHAFLFTGVRGVGKTTSARILAKALNCLGPPGEPEPRASGPRPEPCLQCAACEEIAEGLDVDVREIDGASYTGVDEIRKLQESLPYQPARDRYKIIIVDEVHMLSTNAWNALLKTLEEPPPHVKFIFATTEVHKVPVTILSRVQRFDFRLISSRVIAERVRFVLQGEGVEADDAAVALVAREAAGSMRDALSLLDQAVAFSPRRLVGEELAEVLGIAGHPALRALATSVVKKDPKGALQRVAELAQQSCDLTVVARDLQGLLRDIVVAKVCADSDDLLDLTDEERAAVKQIADGESELDLVRLQRGFAQSHDEVARSGDPRAALEMLLVRLSLRPPMLPMDELMARLSQLEGRLSAGPPPGGGAGPGRGSPGGRPPPAGVRGGGAGRARSHAAPAALVAPPKPTPEPGRSVRGEAHPGASGLVSEVSRAGPRGHRSSSAAPAEAPGAALHAEPAVRQPAPPLRAVEPVEPLDPTPAAPRTPLRDEAPANEPLPTRVERAGGPTGSVQAPPTPDRAPSPRAAPGPPRSRPRPAAPAAAPGTNASSRPAGGDALPLWGELLDGLGSSRPDLQAVFQHAVPLELSREKLVLGLQSGNALEPAMRTPDALAELARAAAAKLGAAPAVEFRAVEGGLETLANAEKRIRNQRRKEAEEAAHRHPSIVDAVEILGARVKRVDVR